MNLEEAHKELRNIAGTKYIGLEIKITEFSDTPKETVYGVYMDGSKWHNAPTWIEALAGLEKEIREKSTVSSEDTNEDNI